MHIPTGRAYPRIMHQHPPTDRRSYYAAYESDWSIDDQLTLVDFLQARRMNVAFVDIDALVRWRLRHEVVERGVSAVMREPTRLQEDLVGPGVTRNAYTSLVAEMVDKLSPKISLMLVDPYLLAIPKATAKAVSLSAEDLAADILDAIGPAVSAGVALTFCHDAGGRPVTSAIKQELDARGFAGSVEFRTTGDFHDRFIVVDGTSGLFLGASFNSVGKRYSLVDYLSPRDAVDIAAAAIVNSKPA